MELISAALTNKPRYFNLSFTLGRGHKSAHEETNFKKVQSLFESTQS